MHITTSAGLRTACRRAAGGESIQSFAHSAGSCKLLECQSTQLLAVRRSAVPLAVFALLYCLMYAHLVLLPAGLSVKQASTPTPRIPRCRWCCSMWVALGLHNCKQGLLPVPPASAPHGPQEQQTGCQQDNAYWHGNGHSQLGGVRAWQDTVRNSNTTELSTSADLHVHGHCSPQCCCSADRGQMCELCTACCGPLSSPPCSQQSLPHTAGRWELLHNPPAQCMVQQPYLAG